MCTTHGALALGLARLSGASLALMLLTSGDSFGTLGWVLLSSLARREVSALMSARSCVMTWTLSSLTRRLADRSLARAWSALASLTMIYGGAPLVGVTLLAHMLYLRTLLMSWRMDLSIPTQLATGQLWSF